MFNKSRAWAVGLLIAVAVAGFAAGAATEGWVVRHRRGGDRGGYSGYLTHELNLSAAQHDSIAAILRRHRAELHAIFLTIRPQVDSARTRISDEIRAVLTPEQRPAYQKLLDRDRAERARADSAAAAQVKTP
jgi:Spy/CpxP family protein refolding chaperone